VTSRPADVVEMLTADHHELSRLVTELESGGLAPEERRRLAEVVVAELVRHSVAEEEYLYPAAREALVDSGAIADAGLATHRDAEEVMKQLLEAAPDSPEFDRLARRLAELARAHIQLEEDGLLARLRTECDPGELRRLAVLVGMAKDSAPTRPHPSAPHRPPWNLLFTPGIGIVDQLRDSASGRPTHRSDLEPGDDDAAGRRVDGRDLG
jgi:hemerythrin superfamily protein